MNVAGYLTQDKNELTFAHVASDFVQVRSI